MLRKRACKPSSVPLRARGLRPLGGLRPHVRRGGSHLSSPGVAAGVERPTRGLVGHRIPLFGLAPDGVCPDPRCCHRGGELLPRHFTLIPSARDGMFLWHFPSGCPAPPLAGILARWCSDFSSLPSNRNGGCPALLRPTIVVRLPGLCQREDSGIRTRPCCERFPVAPQRQGKTSTRSSRTTIFETCCSTRARRASGSPAPPILPAPRQRRPGERRQPRGPRPALRGTHPAFA